MRITVSEISRVTGGSLVSIRNAAEKQDRYDAELDEVEVTELEMNILFELNQRELAA